MFILPEFWEMRFQLIKSFQEYGGTRLLTHRRFLATCFTRESTQNERQQERSTHALHLAERRHRNEAHKRPRTALLVGLRADNGGAVIDDGRLRARGQPFEGGIHRYRDYRGR